VLPYPHRFGRYLADLSSSPSAPPFPPSFAFSFLSPASDYSNRELVSRAILRASTLELRFVSRGIDAAAKRRSRSLRTRAARRATVTSLYCSTPSIKSSSPARIAYDPSWCSNRFPQPPARRQLPSSTYASSLRRCGASTRNRGQHAYNPAVAGRDRDRHGNRRRGHRSVFLSRFKSSG